MPTVMNLEVYEGRRPASSSPADKIVPTTTSSPDKSGTGEVVGHYATSRIIKCWNCGGLSYAVCDDTLTNQVFTCAVCGQANQL